MQTKEIRSGMDLLEDPEEEVASTEIEELEIIISQDPTLHPRMQVTQVPHTPHNPDRM